MTEDQGAMAEREWLRPSQVFVRRLREIRTSRPGMSQTELARLVTAQGQPLSKAALLRIENGTRGLSLDEALALAWALRVAPAHLLTPPADTWLALTNDLGIDSGIGNWLLFGEPLLLTPPGQRARLRIGLAQAIEVYAQAIIDAKNGGDDEGLKRAVDALHTTIAEHHTGITELEEES